MRPHSPSPSRALLRTVALLISVLSGFPASAQDFERRQWDSIPAYQDVLIRLAEDTLVGLERDGRRVLFRRIGNLRYMRKDMAPALVSRLTLSTPDRTEPVTSMDWVGIKSDTATLVVGFGKIRSSTEFKEVRIHAAGLEAVYGISERESGRIAGKVRGFRQAFAVLAVVGGTIGGAYVGARIGEAQEEDGIPSAVTTLEKGISGASLGFLAGLLAAYHITTKD